jgi:hypothetical protein
MNIVDRTVGIACAINSEIQRSLEQIVLKKSKRAAPILKQPY